MNRSGSVLIFKSLIFVLIFFMLLFHISGILRPSITIEGNNEKLGMLGYYAEPKNTIDVLYFGSSDATAFWIPFKAYEQAGFTSYTYGKSMMRASMFEDMLDEALKTQSPSLVIISLRTILQSGDTVEEAGSGLAYVAFWFNKGGKYYSTALFNHKPLEADFPEQG